MFQNLANRAEELNKKDVKEKNKNINLDKIKDIFTIQNIIIYILSFLISTVSIKDGLFPFGFAFFVAACSSTIPAGPVLVTTFLGILISQGSGAFLIYFLNILIFLLTVVIIKPYVQEDRNEVTKLGINLIIASAIVQAIKCFTGTFLIYDVITAIITVILTYIFYKIFVKYCLVFEKLCFKNQFML